MQLHVVVPQIVSSGCVRIVVDSATPESVEMVVPALERAEFREQAQVPLSDKSRAVAGLLQQRRQGGLPNRLPSWRRRRRSWTRSDFDSDRHWRRVSASKRQDPPQTGGSWTSAAYAALGGYANLKAPPIVQPIHTFGARPPKPADQAATNTVLKAKSLSLRGLARVLPFWSTMVMASPDVSDRGPLVV